MKALSKEPGDRYSSVEEFSKDVSRYLSGARVEAPRFSAQKRTKPDSFLRAPANSKALAVLPFKFLNLAAAEETDDGFLGLGLADALITRLSRVRRFVVRPTSSILSFGDELIDPIRAGKELNVDYILEGSIKKAKDRVRVTVQLLNVAENAAVWATSIDEVLSDVFTLEDMLANKVIEVLLPQLTRSELEEFANRGTTVPEAFEHYLRGRFYFNGFTEDGFAKAFVSFHSAIAADPNYAHAYAGIADYYNWLGILGVLPPQECYIPAMEAATKAVELDDNLSEAHTSLGISLHAGKYEWSRAAHHLTRAIELNPSNASAYVWYSTVLYTMGRFDEGLDYAFRCVELDPLTPFYHHNIAWGLYYARRYDQAAERYKKVIADFPKYGFGYYGLSKIHRITGETKLAIRENEKAMEMMGDSVFSLLSEAECYAADRQTSAANQKLSALHKLAEERYVSPYQLALVYSYLGDTEKVIEFLGKADETKEAWLNWMGVDPLFDFVRDDRRFDSILNRTGYRLFQKGFVSDRSDANVTRNRPDNLHNLTTLVIDGELTDDGLSPVRPRSRFIPAAGILLVILSILAVAFFGFQWMREDVAVNRPVVFQNASIVVLPFKSSDAVNENLGVGLADALTGRLGNIKNLQVISASTGRAMANDSPEKIASVHDIAFVLRGNIANEDGGTTLFAELLNARDESTVWAEHFTAADGDLFGLQARVAERIWTSLGIAPLPIEHQQVVKRYTRSNSAYQQYLVGRFQMTNRSAGNLRKAIETFSASLEEDPNFAPAYVGLADAYSLLNLYDIDPPADSYSRALENIKKALLIDADLAEAHASHAYVKFFHERDRAGAELEFRRAIQLNPSYSQAHHWFALTLAAMNRRIEAISEIETAKRLDPLSAAVRSAAGVVHFQSGFFKEAIEESNAALALDRGAVPAHKVKRWAFTSLNDPVSAMYAFESEIEFSGGNRSEPGWRIFELQIAALGDDRGEVVRKLDAISANPSIAKNAFAFAFEIAIAYNALGDSRSALNWLERSGAANAHSFNFLEVDPRLANLRTEPRFQALARTLQR